jgi:serine/threonine-protein kinase
VAKTLEPGVELDDGKYRILRLLGQGGMGSVFEAEHRDTKKHVAIKCLHPVHAADPEVAERLIREAQATARVRHPNVVDVYDVGRDGDTVYLVMQYLEGEPLSQPLLRRDLPMHTIIALLLPAIRGVDAAHKQGVIHRDLKPDNIFLAVEADAARPVPKVLDFGISKLEVRGTVHRSLTRSGVAVGTPSYMSYEQLTGEPDIDGRVDVYAFGVILYEALTGKVPYEADTFPELMIRFASSTPPPPKILRPGVPTTLSRVVMWALEKDRADRIPSMAALALELEPFSTQAGFEAEQTQTLSYSPQPEPMGKRDTPSGATPGRNTDSESEPAAQRSQSRRRRVASALAVGCLLLMAALGALFAESSRSNEPSKSMAPLASGLGPSEAPTLRAAETGEPRDAPLDAPAPPQPAIEMAPEPAREASSQPTLPVGVAPSPSNANRWRNPAPRVEPAKAPAAKSQRVATPRDFGIY